MVLFYSERRSSRLDYICNQILGRVIGYEYRMTDNENELLSFDGPSICYAKDYKGKGLHIVPCGLLFEETLTPQQLEVSEWQSMPIFYRTEGTDIPFDIFASSFYLITRYEEYLDADPDKHGRFKAENSLAYQNGFLERPLVDEWALALRSVMQSKYGVEPEMAPSFRFEPTIDVDHAFAFRHKGPIVNGKKILEALLDKDFKRMGNILKVVFRLKRDPFFNFEKLCEIHAPFGRDAHLFFHCGGRGKYDKRTFFPSWRYFLAKRKSDRFITAGLHPSYRAASTPWLFRLERNVMACAVKHSVDSCRFHYLKCTFPDSYDMLAQAGFKDDWSMIYSNDPGFRASTSFPFYFYNLKKEKAYALLIHPTAVMDKTLHSNKGMSVDEAYDYIMALAQKVEAVNGHFVTLFHNDHLTDAFEEWRGWETLYRRIINHFPVETSHRGVLPSP